MRATAPEEQVEENGDVLVHRPAVNNAAAYKGLKDETSSDEEDAAPEKEEEIAPEEQTAPSVVTALVALWLLTTT